MGMRNNLSWNSLGIISKQNGQLSDKEGYVEFKALFMVNCRVECIHENSYFVKENNKWHYKSGTHK